MIGPIKDLYVRRMKSLNGEIPDYYSCELNAKIRNKIIYAILEYQVYPLGFHELNDLAKELTMDLGLDPPINLTPIKRSYELGMGGTDEYLSGCSKDEFLSALELLVAIKVKNLNRLRDSGNVAYNKVKQSLQSLIDKINSTFRIDKIGYEIVPAGLEDLPYIIVRYNSKYLHLETIKQPLSLMHDEDFKGALKEFESALDEHRKSGYKGAILNATKAYESTLKTILDLKKVPYTTEDKIPALVSKVKEAGIINSKFKSIFEPFWPVLRNGGPQAIRNEYAAHGQSGVSKDVEKSHADFVLRIVGTYIVFLIERYKETKETK